MPEELLSRNGTQESHVLSREVIKAMEQLHPDQREVLVLVCAGVGAQAQLAAPSCADLPPRIHIFFCSE